VSLLFDSLRRHWQMTRAAIAADRERAAARTASDAPQFLPAALEVIDQPVSPTARRTALVLGVLMLAALVWAMVGKTDVVVSAPGSVLPSGSSKVVQSAALGVVAAIHVRDGDHVRRGAAVIDFDTTTAGAEVEQAQKALLSDQLDIAMDRALVDGLSGKGFHFVPPPGAPAELAETRRALVAAQLAEVNSAVAGYAAARSSSEAEARAAAATRAKLEGMLPIVQREVGAMQDLDAQGYAPGMRLLDLQRQLRSDQGDRDVAAVQVSRGQADAAKYAQAMVQTREQSLRQALADLGKAQADAVLKSEDVTKAMRRATLQHLVAPIDGTVQQLAVHTIGGVVETGKAVMVIVPDQPDVEVEAKVRNRDAGFIKLGQAVAVKLDAFPFSRYGTVSGRVIALSRDAVPDPKLGPVFVTRIRLDRATITIDGREVPLGAGLGVTADIRTGSRTIMSWLLSPILTTVKQAAREQ
jgi:hemolysin D